MKRFLSSFLVTVSVVIFVLIAFFGSSLNRFFGSMVVRLPVFNQIQRPSPDSGTQREESVRVVSEESVVIDVAERVSPSVVTVSIKKTLRSPFSEFDPFLDPFGFFQPAPFGQEKKVEQDIGSGFV